MKALATWCFRHRRIVVGAWTITLIVVLALSKAVGNDYSDNFTLPDTDSTRALDLLKASSPQVSGDTEQIVWGTTGTAKVTDPAIKSEITGMLDKVSQLPHIGTVTSPYDTGGAERISTDGTVAFATVTFDVEGQYIKVPEAKTFVRTAQSAHASNLKVAVSGQVAEVADAQSVGGTGFGLILAAVVLLLVFGSLFAMALPLLSAVLALGTATGLIVLLSNALPIPEFATQLTLLIGLGVGVDYALFIVTRHRQGLLAGKSVEESAVTAGNTSGRAVMFAGIIVCIALLGMFTLGVNFLRGLAVSASLGVLLTMFAAVTFIPAMLGFVGPKVLSRKQRKSLAEHGARESGSTGFWARWSDVVQSRPAVPAVIATLLILLVAAPFLSLRLGSSDQGNDPKSSTTRQAYDLLADGFGPGFNGPLMVVGVVHDATDEAALTKAVTAIKATRGVASVATPRLIDVKDGTKVALVDVYSTGAPQDKSTTDLIKRVRNDALPDAVAGSRLHLYVGGDTAIFDDFSHVLARKLPLFVGVVVLLSFLLLAVVFRSIVVPLTAAVMNLLSAGAAFGILVAVFQWGWLGSAFGVTRNGPIEAFIPVMMFAILFGLSMDYEVFLVARIHEEWLHGGDNAKAVRNGLATTGKTITAAALIMILVFGSFILGGERVIKEFGLGLAGGVFIDAVVIRSAIIPAVMFLLGKTNWWFPDRLDKVLPHLSVESEVDDDREPVTV